MTRRSILFLSAKKRPIREPLVTANHFVQRRPTCALCKIPNHVVATCPNLAALRRWFHARPQTEHKITPISRISYLICQGNHYERHYTYASQIRPTIDMINTIEKRQDDLQKWHKNYITGSMSPPPQWCIKQDKTTHQQSVTLTKPRITCGLCDMNDHRVNQCRELKPLANSLRIVSSLL